MRPYFAVIKDSFREALASRVLWVLTGLIGLFLMAIAPIGYKLNLTGEFAWGDIAESGLLVEDLRKAEAGEAASPGKRIWSLFDESTKSALAKVERRRDEERRGDGERRRGRDVGKDPHPREPRRPLRPDGDQLAREREERRLVLDRQRRQDRHDARGACSRGQHRLAREHEGPPHALGASRYRVAWRAADGTLEERFTEDPTALLHTLTAEALARGERLEDLSVMRPSLEDVYLELTSSEALA